MSISTQKGLWRRLAMLAAMTALMVGLGTSAAYASVTLSPAGPYSSSTSTEVTVSGTPTGAAAGATHVAIVVCNIASPPNIGKRCDKASGSGGESESLEPVANFKGEGITISVRRGVSSILGWQDFNYTKGTPPSEVPGSTTLCKNEAGTGEQCGVIVSFYEETEEGFALLPPESKSISFN